MFNTKHTLALSFDTPATLALAPANDPPAPLAELPPLEAATCVRCGGDSSVCVCVSPAGESGPFATPVPPESGTELAAEPSEDEAPEGGTHPGAAASYDPCDDKIRLRFPARLDRPLFDRLRAAGFIRAYKQDLFVAPKWTPERFDLAVELAGEVGDEDTTLADRSEQRAERFDGYHEKRTADAHGARAAVARIADGIPFGQPILVGHHSERHARRDAKRIESGMRRAVDMWSRAEYWERRAAGVLRLARTKENPGVRHRRIKGLEADLRKYTKELDRSRAFRAAWAKEGLTREGALKIANFDHGSSVRLWSRLTDGTIEVAEAVALALASHDRVGAHYQRWADHVTLRLGYERAMLGESGGIKADGFKLEVGGRVLAMHWTARRSGWVVITKVNRAAEAEGGAILSVSTPGGVVPVEAIQEYRAPSEEDAAKVKAALKLAPMVNREWGPPLVASGARSLPLHRDGGKNAEPGAASACVHMTKAEWAKTYKDYKGSRTTAPTAEHGAYRYRIMCRGGGSFPVFLTDDKVHELPKPAKVASADPDSESDDAPESGESETIAPICETPAPEVEPEAPESEPKAPEGETPAAEAEPLTVTLHGTSIVVLAKTYKGRPSAMTYANRTQAEKAAAKLGAGWVVHKGIQRPFFVAKLPPVSAPQEDPAGAQAGRGDAVAELAPPAPVPPDLAPSSTASPFPVGSLAAELDADAPEDPAAVLAPVVDALVLAREFKEAERRNASKTAREAKEAAAAPFRAMEASLKGGAPVAIVVVDELFPTPRALAERLVTAAGVRKGMRVLEPSAGTGNVAAECVKRGAAVALVEVSGACVERLRVAHPGMVKHADFLTLSLSDLGTFDAIVMNPPFSDEIAHVTHALSFLNVGGKLAAIMSAAVAFRRERKYQAFRERVEAMGGTIEDLPEGSFKPQSGVSTVLVTVRR
jgi:predicted RNA methylase